MSHALKQSAHPKVVVRKVINASREQIFDAFTEPALMERWFFPGAARAKTTTDLRVGGKYSHDMIMAEHDSSCQGTVGSDGMVHYLHTGEYLEIRRPERLVFTWSSPAVTNTRVSVDLKALGNSTEVTITHELLETDEARESHSEGWQGCLTNLATLFN